MTFISSLVSRPRARRRPGTARLAAWVLVAGASLLITHDAAAQAIAITARHVFDGETMRRNTTVVVEGGRITSVGPLPAGFRGERYDLGDATLLPGLIDVHAHVAWHFNPQGRLHTAGDGETPSQGALAAAGNAWATLRSGVTTIQSPGSPEDLELRDAIARGVVPGPRVLTSAGSLNETAGSPDEIRQRIRDFKARGADVIKLFASKSIRDGGAQTMSDAQLAAACGEAHQLGLRVLVHAHASEAMMAAIEAGCDQIEHGIFATDAVLRLMAERGTYLSPQCGLIFRNYLENRARYQGIGNYNDEGFAAMEQAMPVGVAAVRRAVNTPGLKVVFGTDAVAGAHGRNVEDLICRMTEAGQAPLAALRSATSLAAASIGRSDSLGTLAPGRIADLAAFAGDVTADPTRLRTVRFVMQGGRVVRYEVAQ